MSIISDKDLFDLIQFNCYKSQSITFDKLLEIGGIENHVLHLRDASSIQIDISDKKSELEKLGWNINSVIKVSSLYKNTQVGAGFRSGFIMSYIFIRDKDVNEIISICKKVIKMKAFI